MGKKHRPILVFYYNPAHFYSQKVLKFLKDLDVEIPPKNVNENAKAHDKFHLLENTINWLSEKRMS